MFCKSSVIYDHSRIQRHLSKLTRDESAPIDPEQLMMISQSTGEINQAQHLTKNDMRDKIVFQKKVQKVQN